MKKTKPVINISKSFREAREWEIEYEESLTPEERHEAASYLRKMYCIRKGIKFDEIKPVFKKIDQKKKANGKQ